MTPYLFILAVLLLGALIALIQRRRMLRLRELRRAPVSPQNGDMWITTCGLFVRINGQTCRVLTDPPR